MTTTKQIENHKDLQKNLMFDFLNGFIGEYLHNTQDVDILQLAKESLQRVYKINKNQSFELIDLWKKEFPFTYIMIKNVIKFKEYAESYYKQIRDKGTVLDFNFFQKLVEWIDKVPEDNKLEIAKRMFVYEFISEKAVVNE